MPNHHQFIPIVRTSNHSWISLHSPLTTKASTFFENQIYRTQCIFVIQPTNKHSQIWSQPDFRIGESKKERSLEFNRIESDWSFKASLPPSMTVVSVSLYLPSILLLCRGLLLLHLNTLQSKDEQRKWSEVSPTEPVTISQIQIQKKNQIIWKKLLLFAKKKDKINLYQIKLH